MSDKQRFQEIIAGIRSDLKYLAEGLYLTLIEKINENNYHVNEGIKNWIFDTFLDKLYEIDARITTILGDFGLKAGLPVFEIKRHSEQIAYEKTTYPHEMTYLLENLHESIEKYGKEVETQMSVIRKFMYKTDWKQMKKIKPVDYVLPVRRERYVKARDELQKAKEAVKAKKWDEVLNHLRPAIDLAIKEKFGFRRIFPMKQFLSDAEEYNLLLPSYTMIYDYFDEGSHRIHEGKLNTPWECEKALSFVAEFIDRLDLVNVSQEDINEFKRKSNAVD